MRSLFEIALISAIFYKGVTAQDDNEGDEVDGDDLLADDVNPEDLIMDANEQMADYPDWTAAVEALGYTEESFYVDTEDGWRIPLLHITGKVGEDAQDLDNSLGTVLILHGSLMSAISFANKGAPTLPFQLADEGFDVWLGSMRGTADSSCTPGSDCGLNCNTETITIYQADADGNQVLGEDGQPILIDQYDETSCSIDKMINFADKGTYDLPALVDGVLWKTEAQRVSLVGFSQGTSQSFHGVAKNPNLESQIDHMVMLAPCIWGESLWSLEKQIEFAEFRMDNGIVNTLPEQFAEQAEIFCDAADEEGAGSGEVTPFSTFCQLYTFVASDAGSIYREISDFGTQDYYYQLAEAGTFQDYIPADEWIDGEDESLEIKLSSIDGPRVSLYVGVDDQACTPGMAKKIYDELGTTKKTLTIIEYKDDTVKLEDPNITDPWTGEPVSVNMDHDSWGMPLSESILTRVTNSLKDSANFLALSVSAAAVSAIALY